MQPQLVKLIRDTRAGWGKHADPGLAGKELFRGGGEGPESSFQ